MIVVLIDNNAASSLDRKPNIQFDPPGRGCQCKGKDARIPFLFKLEGSIKEILLANNLVIAADLYADLQDLAGIQVSIFYQDEERKFMARLQPVWSISKYIRLSFP